MTSKWLNQILLCAILQCMVFTATALPTITINGNSSSPQTFKINDVVKINCTVSPNYTSIAGFNLQKGGRTYYRIENSNTGEVNKTITCDDNTSYKCYGIFNRSREYSSNIYVIAECPPDWSASMKERSFFFSPWSLNKYFDFPIFGQPQPTYSAQKLTSTGFQDVSPNIDVQSYTNKLRLYFRTYSDEYHGIYRLLANNSLGKFATNITFRGSTLPAKNVVAWSTSPDSVHVEWVAGELFDTKPRYYVYYKIETWTTNPQYVYDIGSTVTYTFNSAKPNTTYYFMIAVATKYGTSSYSNIAQATSLSPGDPPQAKPIYEPTDSTTSKSTVVGQSVASDCTNCEEDVPTFEAGIGLGVGIGLILLIISVLGTVIYFKKSLIKREEVPEANQNHPAESEPGMYMNVGDHTYEKLSHPNRGNKMIRWLKKKCKGKQRSQDEVRLPITTTTTNCSSLVYKTGNSFEKTGNYSGAKDCDFSEFHVSGVYICNTVKQCVSTDSGLDCDIYFHDETESTVSSTHQLVGSNRDGKDNLKSELYVQRRSRALHKTGKPARAHSVLIKSRSSTDKCRKWLSTNFLNKKAKEQSAIANTENFGRQVNSKSKSSQHIERLEVLKQIEDNWLESDNDSSDEDDPHQTMKILDYSREPGCFFQSDLSDSGNSSETKSCYSSVDSLSLCNEVKFPNFTTSTGFGTNKWYRS